MYPCVHVLSLTCPRFPPVDGQADLAVAGGAVHQVDDVAVRLARYADPVHRHQLVPGPQAAILVGGTLLDDGPDQDLWVDRGVVEGAEEGWGFRVTVMWSFKVSACG